MAKIKIKTIEALMGDDIITAPKVEELIESKPFDKNLSGKVAKYKVIKETYKGLKFYKVGAVVTLEASTAYALIKKGLIEPTW